MTDMMSCSTVNAERQSCSADEVLSHQAASCDESASQRTLIVDVSGNCSAEYAIRTTSAAELVATAEAVRGPASRVVLFLPSRPTACFKEAAERCVAVVAGSDDCDVCLVSSFRSHFDKQFAAFEDSIAAQFQQAAASTIVLRVGQVIDAEHRVPTRFRWLAPFYPLVPNSITSGFLTRQQLFSAIDQAAAIRASQAARRLTLLGSRRGLRDVLADFVRPGALSSCLTMIAFVLSWLQLGRIAGFLFAAASSFVARWRCWQLETLEPQSADELLSLYNPLNQSGVALAGYNTGVTHFGWKYPGKTVVRTTSTGRLVRIRERTVTVDAGVLLKRVIGELRAQGKELFVVPNYSYISLGTTFMVPVHGSGSEVSTLGDSIESVLAYDPTSDEFVRLRRGDERFGRCMYNPTSGLLVLRLTLRIRESSRYFVKRTQLMSPSAADIWQTFADPTASNIELRKSRAAESFVEVSKYYTAPSDDQQTLEIPRDSIGRLWDRLEENPVSSWLFHTFVRKFGFHVELFLDEREFEIFWQAHTALPLSKLQLRLVMCDGLSHSPFGDRQRISADIFMKRRDSAAFVSFMKDNLPHARFNPGKHSM